MKIKLLTTLTVLTTGLIFNYSLQAETVDFGFASLQLDDALFVPQKKVKPGSFVEGRYRLKSDKGYEVSFWGLQIPEKDRPKFLSMSLKDHISRMAGQMNKKNKPPTLAPLQKNGQVTFTWFDGHTPSDMPFKMYMGVTVKEGHLLYIMYSFQANRSDNKTAYSHERMLKEFKDITASFK